ncbi:MAG TPA: alpha-amylase/4-alpha-glucanotransferase domain-containing protein [Gemmatimonadales bacterium]|nr:alpha-amylase/4-alpha-glucanotransferase domain-containing protein [Gemmatimonadales bacterium]
MSHAPVRFLFGVHLHQPVGNFDHVFAQHVDQVYLPFLEALAERQAFPIALHVSGPLLEWMEAHDRRYLDLVGPLAADGRVELLLSGLDEPILAALPRPDRTEQIGWMREALCRLFGVEATTLWLTERVWEPELAADLADAGVGAVLVDDRHLLICGLEREELHRPYHTEHAGRTVALLPIDERLRYLVPFKPPSELAAYFRALAGHGAPLAVLADDGEKFGGWPGTRDWVYERGWLRAFLDTLLQLLGHGEVRLVTASQAVAEVETGGLMYLPTASYREMEGWSLRPAAAQRLTALEREWSEQRLAGPDGPLLRGSHWRNFLSRYPEANRLHKTMCRLSALARERGNPREARRAVGRAQCNDAYWHGVFGGLYLPHLRGALWRELARAEGGLRRGEPLHLDVLDFESDGHHELWIHSGHFSALVSPRRGGAIEAYTVFAAGVNYADVLTRRREAYHRAGDGSGAGHGPASGAPSIHDLEKGLAMGELPPFDHDLRALLVDRVLPASASPAAFATGQAPATTSWAGRPFSVEWRHEGTDLLILLRPRDEGTGLALKTLRFAPAGLTGVEYRWEPTAFPPNSWFTTELSLAAALELDAGPTAEAWSYPVTTRAKSERGFDETVQGLATVIRWPVSAGRGALRVGTAPVGA